MSDFDDLVYGRITAESVGLLMTIVGVVLFVLFGIPALILLFPLFLVLICVWVLLVLAVKTIKNPSDPQIFGDEEHPVRIRTGIAVGCIIIGALCSWWFWSVLTDFLN